MIRLNATQRLLSQKTNQEKITHYSKMLNKVKTRLLGLDSERQPKTTQHYMAWAIRLEKRIFKLKTQHRH
jgi:hypothetical protein